MPYRLIVAGLILILVVMQYQLWFGRAGIVAYQRLDVKIDAFADDNQKLVEANDELRQQVKDLKHGVDLIEELARYELNLIGEDETFFRYVEEEADVDALTESAP